MSAALRSFRGEVPQPRECASPRLMIKPSPRMVSPRERQRMTHTVGALQAVQWPPGDDVRWGPSLYPPFQIPSIDKPEVNVWAESPHHEPAAAREAAAAATAMPFATKLELALNLGAEEQFRQFVHAQAEAPPSSGFVGFVNSCGAAEQPEEPAAARYRCQDWDVDLAIGPARREPSALRWEPCEALRSRASHRMEARDREIERGRELREDVRRVAEADASARGSPQQPLASPSAARRDALPLVSDPLASPIYSWPPTPSGLNGLPSDRRLVSARGQNEHEARAALLRAVADETAVELQRLHERSVHAQEELRHLEEREQAWWAWYHQMKGPALQRRAQQEAREEAAAEAHARRLQQEKLAAKEAARREAAEARERAVAAAAAADRARKEAEARDKAEKEKQRLAAELAEKERVRRLAEEQADKERLVREAKERQRARQEAAANRPPERESELIVKVDGKEVIRW
eukprot:jgi/Chrpa1/8461/Chrysochromulina_OHIO_Genome00015053-RA